MKAKTATFVNIRNSPNKDNPRTGILNPGVELEVEKVEGKNVKDIVNGKEIESSEWYKDASGHYYWGGGVDLLSIGKNRILETGNWYFDNFGITDIWNELGEGNCGKNIKVAILDTGIDQTTGKLLNIKEQKRFYSNEDETKCLSEDIAFDSDSYFHGTRCASVIGAKPIDGYFSGVAPDCDIYIYRIKDDFFFNPSKIQIPFTLNYILNNHPEIDIISMSFQFAKSVDGLEKVLSDCAKTGILLFAASGNILNDESSQYAINYPGFYDSCNEVGACDENMKKIISTSNFNEKTKILAPGINVPVLTNMQHKATEGYTSIATAFTAGVAALLLSYVRKTNPDKKDSALKVINALIGKGLPVELGNKVNQSIISQIIQPYQSFKVLKS